MAGRKSLKDELKMFERYSELTEPYFKVLKKHLDSGEITNEKWAVEQLTKAFVKMIPQTLDGMGENGEVQIQIVNYANSSQLPTETLPTSPITSD